MLTLRAPAVLLLQGLLLLAVGLPLGWGAAGWVVALGSVVVLDAAGAKLLRRSRVHALGPANLVTLLRVTLACGLTALVAESLLSSPSLDRPALTASVVALASVALVLDLVDGWVARRTGTASAFGARVDGEADAYLMLVLCVWVAPSVGWWVLAIGLARYAFAVAGWLLPWLRAQLPARYWRKVVAATAGIALTVAAAGVVPSPLVDAVLVVVLLLIVESFGRDVWWLWRHRSTSDVTARAGVP